MRFFHQETALLPTVTSQWISVPEAIVYLLQEDIQWNTFGVNNDAHFALIDTLLGTTTETANAAFFLATTGSATAITALGQSTTNSVQIANINNLLPTLITFNTASNMFVSSNNLSNLNINHGFINSNITTQQYIHNLKCDTLNLNTGNINNINGISVDSIQYSN